MVDGLFEHQSAGGSGPVVNAQGFVERSGIDGNVVKADLRAVRRIEVGRRLNQRHVVMEFAEGHPRETAGRHGPDLHAQYVFVPCNGVVHVRAVKRDMGDEFHVAGHGGFSSAG